MKTSATKKCSCCGKRKRRKEFYRNPNSKDGHHARCKVAIDWHVTLLNAKQ